MGATLGDSYQKSYTFFFNASAWDTNINIFRIIIPLYVTRINMLINKVESS